MKWFYFREMTEDDVYTGVGDELMHCVDEVSKDWLLVMDYQKEGVMFLQYLGYLTSTNDIRKFLLEEKYTEISNNLIPIT